MKLRTITTALCLFLAGSAGALTDSGATAVRDTLFDRAFWPGHGVCYGPHRDGQRPGGADPTPDQIREDLELMRQHWRLLKVYGSRGAAETALRIIADQGWDLKVMVGVWIAPDDTAANSAEIAKAAELAGRYPQQVWAVSVGNETQVSWSAHKAPLEVLIDAVRRVRSRVNVPVTTADDYQFWLEPRSGKLDAELDFLTMHAHPMWNGKQLAEALPWVRETLEKVRAAHPGKKVVVGETGWATSVADHGEQAELIKGRPGEKEQAQFYRDIRRWALDAGETVFFFEAFDENWKGGDDSAEVEKHWGVFRADRSAKAAMEQGGADHATPEPHGSAP